jgi:hypothetical protein
MARGSADPSVGVAAGSLDDAPEVAAFEWCVCPVSDSGVTESGLEDVCACSSFIIQILPDESISRVGLVGLPCSVGNLDSNEARAMEQGHKG